jgi:hypothetical protein
MVSINLSYSVSFARSARKELESLGRTVAFRILKKIESLPANPRPAGCKNLQARILSGESESAIIELFIPLTIQTASSTSLS